MFSHPSGTSGGEVLCPGDRVLLTSMPTLAFIRGHMVTTHRRTSAIPQLICDDNGTAGCREEKAYLFKSAICENQGVDDDMEQQWACTANNLSESVQLGTVQVSCEGYSNSYDPYVLVGSCSLTYTLDFIPRTMSAHLFAFFAICFICYGGCILFVNVRPGPPAYEALGSRSERSETTATAVLARAMGVGDILEHSASSEEDVGGLSESKQGGNYQGLPTAVAVQASETTALARNNRIEGDSLPQTH